MQLITRTRAKHFISVYDGISPALLATISLSQNIKGSTHKQLILSLKKSNIIQSQSILSVLNKLDRATFTSQTNKIYDNKPNKISKGQNMTDVFSHSVILNNIQEKIKHTDNLKILDIGTGHGYLAFAVWMLALQLGKIPAQVLGIDCYDECIQKCNDIKANKLSIRQQKLEFKKMDVLQLIESQQKYDIIIGGFFIEPNLCTKLQTILQHNGIGIWPQVSESGQGLFITRKNKPKEYLLETLFSQQVVQSSVEQYFISEHGSAQEQGSDKSNQEQNKQLSEGEKKVVEEKMKLERHKKKGVLQDKLKLAIERNQRMLNVKTLTLKQMQSVPEISSILQQLKRYK